MDNAHSIPRLIASDIDGTFLDPNHRVNQRTRDVVMRAVAAGAHFALATGRPHRWISPVLRQIPLRPLCVTANGAVIYDSAADAVVQAHELAPEVMAEVAEIAFTAMARYGGIALAAERAGTSANDPLESLFVVDYTYSENPNFDGFGVMSSEEVVAEPAVKLLLRNLDFSAPELYSIIAPHVDPELAHVTFSMNEGILEIAAPGITKATGLEWLARHYGVAQADTIVFGDMPNDIEMIRWAGRGVAMGNAAPNVKEAADEVTAANHEHGVAQVLERWF